MGIEPGFLIGTQMIRIPRLVNRIGTVAEDAVIAGQRFHAVCVVIGEVRMLPDEFIQQRHDVIIAD
jgi:hypothetical protein